MKAMNDPKKFPVNKSNNVMRNPHTGNSQTINSHIFGMVLLGMEFNVHNTPKKTLQLINALIIGSIFLLLFCSIPAEAARLNPERFYQHEWCAVHNGKVEHILPNKTRVDCLTPTHAVEVDFADNWYEGIGQSLYYAMETQKDAGLVLIGEYEDDQKYIDRATKTIHYYNLPIKLWVIYDMGCMVKILTASRSE